MCNFYAFFSAHYSRPEGSIGTMMTFQTNTPESCGIVEVADSGLVQTYWEKDPAARGNLANAAVYLVTPEFCDIVTADSQAFDLSKDVIPRVALRMNTYYNNVLHRDIGTLSSYALAQVDYPVAQKKLAEF